MWLTKSRIAVISLVALLSLGLFAAGASTAPALQTLSATLFQAIRKGDAAGVTRLLTRGANANERDAQGYAPLMRAVDCCSTDNNKISIPIVRALLAKGANPNAKNSMGTVVLEYAINAKSLQAVKELLDHGAQVNVLEQYGSFPLERGDAGATPHG